MGYLTILTNVRRYQTHHRWQLFISGRQRTGALCVSHNPIEWKMWFSCLPILTGSAEGQVILGGIAKRLLIAYIIGNISAKKYQNPFTCIRVIASQRWDVFWDTVYLYCRRRNTNDCLHLQDIAKTAINDARLAPTPKPELEIWRKPHKGTRCSLPDFPFDFSTIYRPICHRFAVKTTSGFG